MKRIGFYGGSFNPPHAGHQATILHALTTAQLDELIVAPVFYHPYGKELAPFGQRLAMCEWLVLPFNHEMYRIFVSDIEQRAFRKFGTGHTSDTLHMLIEEHYKDDGERPHIVLIMGSDLRNDISKWAGYDQLMELCVRGWVSFFYVDRVPGLSSTAVRDTIAAGGFVDRWLPREIHDYVFQNGLYRKKDSL